LRNPAIRCGFAIALPVATTGPTPPQWRETSGASPVGGTVLGTRAELSWAGDATKGIDCTLVATGGRELARVMGDPRTGVTLFIASGVHGCPWIGIERAPADNASLTTADWTARLDWQVLHGASKPESWRRDDHWLASRGHRLDLVADERWSGQVKRTLALVDQVTGWAIESEIEQAQELPEGKAPSKPRDAAK
jgi:hypothetical protein